MSVFEAKTGNSESSKVSPDTIVTLGERRYEQLKKGLEREHKGKFVLILIGKGSHHIVGSTRVEVLQHQERKFPGTQGYVRRIGESDDGRAIWF